MTCTNFPSAGLVIGVTTHQVGEIIYLWSGVVWEAISVSIGTEDDVSVPYEFPTVAAYTTSTIVFPVGKIINLLDRGASFTVVAGTGTATGNGIIASTQVSQSAIVIDDSDSINLIAYGVSSSRSAAENLSAIQEAFDKHLTDVTFDLGLANYAFDQAWFKGINCKLRGGGKYDGSILVRHPNYATVNSLNQFYDIADINFITTGQTKDCLEFQYTRRGKVTGNYFEGYDSAIKYPEHTGQNFGQPVNRPRIIGNTYEDCNQFIKGESSVSLGITFTVADLIISDNEGTALLDHVVFDRVDGVTITDNIMFFQGYTGQSTVKATNISIKEGTWIQIHDNKLFESGTEGIILDGCSRYTLHDNLYAYNGQRIESHGLKIVNTPIAGDHFSQGQVHDEVMIEPSGGGISVSANQGRLQIHNNEFQRPGNSPIRYYGVTPLSGNLIGIDMLSTNVIDVKTNDNHVRWGNNNLVSGTSQSCTHTNNISDVVGDGTGVERQTELKTLTLSGTETSVDVTNYEIVNLSQSAPTNITDVINNGTNKSVVFRSFNTNSTFIHNSAKIGLAGNANASLGTRDTLMLQCESATYAGELSRSI